MEFTARDIMAILTVLGTLIALHIKAFYNFFMSIVKMKYKEVPGKQSMFSVVVQWLGYIGFIMYMIVLGSFLAESFYQETPISKMKNMTAAYFFEMAIFIIVTIITVLAAIDTIQKFRYLNRAFRNKLEGELVKLEDDIPSKNMKNIYTFSISAAMFLFIIIERISSGVEAAISKIVLFNNNEKVETFLIALIMELIVSTLLIISINMKEIIKTIKSKSLYLILIDDEEIYCNCYLEYKNHYLVIKKDKKFERYISKTKVKEIRKIRSN